MGFEAPPLAGEELWKSIPGCDGLYEVSSTGRVRSFTKQAKGAVLKPGRDSKGYLRVCILIDGTAKKFMRVHHLVLMAFVGPRPDGQQGCHSDDDKSNNRLSNLRWDTPLGNAADRKKRGYMPSSFHGSGVRGEQNGRARLTAEKVRSIRADTTSSHAALAELHGVNETTIAAARNRESWRHLKETA